MNNEHGESVFVVGVLEHDESVFAVEVLGHDWDFFFAGLNVTDKFILEAASEIINLENVSRFLNYLSILLTFRVKKYSDSLATF